MTVSKALFKSRKTAPTQAALSREFFTFSRNTLMADSLEWWAWTQNCIRCRKEFPMFRCLIRCFVIYFYKTFEITGRMLIEF